jgi:hypothetical protein
MKHQFSFHSSLLELDHNIIYQEALQLKQQIHLCTRVNLVASDCIELTNSRF